MGLERLSVLHIDDHANMRKIVSAILRSLGVQFLYQANDGADGIDAMRIYRPDVVIVDWEMQGITGIEFIGLIRKASDSPNPYVPIIFLTSHSDPQHVREARDAGVSEYLIKPVSASALYSRFMSIINRPRPFVSSRDYFGPCRRRNKNYDYKGPERRVSEIMLED
ncbi:MAG: response regulator [Pseudomonadota bacterium]